VVGVAAAVGGVGSGRCLCEIFPSASLCWTASFPLVSLWRTVLFSGVNIVENFDLQISAAAAAARGRSGGAAMPTRTWRTQT
jgi:hypothetical protein